VGPAWGGKNLEGKEGPPISNRTQWTAGNKSYLEPYHPHRTKKIPALQREKSKMVQRGSGEHAIGGKHLASSNKVDPGHEGSKEMGDHGATKRKNLEKMSGWIQ